MTADEAVEVMARAFAAKSPCEMTQAEALAATRAAIRALHEAGGLVVAEMPASVEGAGEFLIADNDRMRHAMIAARASGHNAALAAVRARAVAIAEPPHE